MKKLLLALLVASPIGLLTENASAVTAQFPVTRDLGILGHGAEQASSNGAGATARPYKSNQNTMILDFDTVAMANFLSANPGTATWSLNINLVDSNANDITVQTVESTNDWAEGDGDAGGGGQSGVNFNWTNGTTAATYLYAQTAQNSAGTQVDHSSSLQWNDPDSGTYTFTKRGYNGIVYGAPGPIDGDPTPQFTNSASFLAGDLVAGTIASVALDSDIIAAMINDANNRGLRTGTYGVQSGGGNFRIYQREDSGGERAAYLEVTVIPEPSSLLLLLVGACFVSRRRR